MAQGTSSLTRITKSMQIQGLEKTPYERPSIRRDYAMTPQIVFVSMLTLINSWREMSAFLRYYDISIDRSRIHNMSDLRDYLCKIVYGDNAKTTEQLNQESVEITKQFLSGNFSLNGPTSK